MLLLLLLLLLVSSSLVGVLCARACVVCGLRLGACWRLASTSGVCVRACVGASTRLPHGTGIDCVSWIVCVRACGRARPRHHAARLHVGKPTRARRRGTARVPRSRPGGASCFCAAPPQVCEHLVGQDEQPDLGVVHRAGCPGDARAVHGQPRVPAVRGRQHGAAAGAAVHLRGQPVNR